jgi:hypothetical protein
MIPFPKRRLLVAQAQTILDLLPDGLDGPVTWRTLVARFLGPRAADALRIPARGTVYFQGRTNTVSAVQRKLGVTVDGLDGTETWSAILSDLAPLPTQPVTPPASDARYPETVRGRTPNRNAGVNTCEGVVVHHCAGTFEGTISWCLKNGTNATYHCVVGFDGRRAILAKDTDRAHHAGRSAFRGRPSCNNFMLGIAVNGNTNNGARRPHPHLTSDEILSVVEWIRAKQAIHKFPDSAITTHRAISPGRKDDVSIEAWAQLTAALQKH